MAPLKLSEKRVTELSNLWTSTLAEPPPQNPGKLWEEHLKIRQILNVSNETPFDFRDTFNRPDKEQSIKDLVEWLDKNQVDHDAVEIRTANNGYGLFAKKDLKENQIPLQLSYKLTLSIDYSANCPDIRKMYESDWVLSSMSNINLAMIVAYVMLSNDKQYTAYINALPSSYQTPLFFTEKEFLSLKPSPVFEASLLMFRAIARHYVYFILRIVKDSVLKTKVPGKAEFNFKRSPFNSNKFTFEFYRWCVSTVATRLNNVPSMEYMNENMTPMIVPALIPLIDFSNYESKEEGSASMVFDEDTKTIQLQLNKPVAKDEEIFLNYGLRSNGDFLLHNGFVPSGKNSGNLYEIRFGLPKTNESTIKQQLLQARNIRPERGAYTFLLDYNTASKLDIKETALWQFALIFVARDLENIKSAENKKKAVDFLIQRVQLLQRAYDTLPNDEDQTQSLVERFIWRLKKSEIELLKLHEQKLLKLQF